MSRNFGVAGVCVSPLLLTHKLPNWRRMMSRIFRVTCAFAVFAMAGVAFATNQVTLQVDPDTADWTVSILASELSGGVAGYNINLEGDGVSEITGTSLNPRAAANPGFGPVGFTVGGNNIAAGTTGVLFSGQDTAFGTIVHGMGQPDGPSNWEETGISIFDGSGTNSPWAVTLPGLFPHPEGALVIGSGSYTGAADTLTLGGLGVNVFAGDTGTAAVSGADLGGIVGEVMVAPLGIPEPSTTVLFGIALIGLAAARKRS